MLLVIQFSGQKPNLLDETQVRSKRASSLGFGWLRGGTRFRASQSDCTLDLSMERSWGKLLSSRPIGSESWEMRSRNVVFVKGPWVTL